MRRIRAVVVAAALGLLASAGQATATTPPGGPAAQALAVGQAAASGQTAGAASGASQSQPANQNISVRVLSPGNSGDVTQSNTADSSATAGNANLTGQTAEQAQDGSCACAGGTQAIGQEADSSQAAQALSVATQHGASNTNIPVRVLSDGHDGDVTQTNAVESDATAANANGTSQSAGQGSAGGSGTQAVGQTADNEQGAAAASKAEQSGAKNTNISVRVLSPGNDGTVSQSNSVGSSAAAGNSNQTGQNAGQGGSGGTQAIGQDADSTQSAGALSVATQHGASNTNAPVRVLSPGRGGDVSQSNSVDSSATAANTNGLEQDAGQAGRGGDCRCAGGGTQAIGQDADNEQTAVALSAATQDGASNTNTPVRVGSWGNDGDVSQSNSVSSTATALNANLTGQGAEQAQSGASGCCAAGGIQAIGQDAKSGQSAGAASAATQSGGRDKCGCPSGGNVNTPVRVDSKGGGGSVTQENAVNSSATAGNLNLTVQEAGQAESDGGQMYSAKPCGCSGGGTQAIGQEAKSEQDATVLSAALQHGAKNENAPVRVGSYGGGGSVEQSNSVGSSATAANLNGLHQGSAQAGGGGTQAIGQEAKNEQGALAASLAAQAGASNTNAPVRVDSKGHDGHVSQSNSVESDAIAGNTNLTIQNAGQESWGGSVCGCHGGIGIQAIGQEAKNEQGAAALSAALQHGAKNENAPVRVGSYGGGGSVEQSNSVGSSATAANLNGLHQNADQDGSGGGGIAIQAIGQSTKNHQGALALSGAWQLGAANSSSPVAVASKGGSGDVSQSNDAASSATAGNINLTKQDAGQEQSGRYGCGCYGGTGIQAVGQESKNHQGALAGSLAIQAFGHGKCGCSSNGNSNGPVAIGSYGSGGSVAQSNAVRSAATAANLNGLHQGSSQAQAAGGIQATGQSAKSHQGAAALSAALQLGARQGRWLDD